MIDLKIDLCRLVLKLDLVRRLAWSPSQILDSVDIQLIHYMVWLYRSPMPVQWVVEGYLTCSNTISICLCDAESK
jgi:hypothetical protein